MKEKFVIALMTISSLCTAQTGNLYNDAVTLHSNLYAAPDPASAERILQFYSNSAVPSLTFSGIITGNSFFNSDTQLVGLTTGPRAAVTQMGVATGAGDAILGFNVANYADGIAKFLIERARQELSMAFFDKLKKDLAKYPELRYLFPSTQAILADLVNHNLNSLLQELRDAFEKDLVNIPKNTLSLRSMNAAVDCPIGDAACTGRVATTLSTLGSNRALVFALYLMQGLTTGQNIFTILNSTVTDAVFCSDNSTEVSSLKFSAVLLDALRSDSDREGLLVGGAKLRSLFGSPTQLNLLLGLVYQKYRYNTCFSGLTLNSRNLEQLLTAIKASSNSFYNSLTSFDNLNAAYQVLKRARNEGTDTRQAVADYVSSSLLTISYSFKGINILTGLPTPPPVQTLVANIEISSDLIIDIHKRNYSGVYGDFIRLVDLNGLVTDPNLRSKVVKLLSFAANMAEAKSSDEVKAAIESAALPPGSFSVKQRSSWSIGVNAYVGYGWDFSDKELYAKSVYAPIGFAISKGLSRKHGGALSLFVSLVDVGSFVSYRLNNGFTDSLKQEVRLESIISPSAQLVLGVPKLPISIAAGWRETPRLFYNNSQSFSIVNSHIVFNFSILIDIPVFNIWTRPYE